MSIQTTHTAKPCESGVQIKVDPDLLVYICQFLVLIGTCTFIVIKLLIIEDDIYKIVLTYTFFFPQKIVIVLLNFYQPAKV